MITKKPAESREKTKLVEKKKSVVKKTSEKVAKTKAQTVKTIAKKVKPKQSETTELVKENTLTTKNAEKSGDKTQIENAKNGDTKVAKSVRKGPVNNLESDAAKDLLPDSFKKTDSLNLLVMAGVTPYVAKNEEYMNAKQLKHFQKVLAAWNKQIVEEMNRVVNNIYTDQINFPDITDRASQEEKFSIELRNSYRERRLLKKIQFSLKKIEEEDFGYCEACGIEIGIKRLEARPTATLCIDCKGIAEMKERQTAKMR